MPVPRCPECRRVLNANGSCVNVIECKEDHTDMEYCGICKHTVRKLLDS